MLLKSVAAGVLSIGLFGAAAFGLPAADVPPTAAPASVSQVQEVDGSADLVGNTCCAKRAYCCTVKRSCCGSSAVVESDN
ncbi:MULTISPECIES: hypothetical protein [Rhodopirellula]|uniref:hypothetical protein n=1 Tax=Rhodopirellula TaxID=265488 RepID=UPI00257ED9FD|nr:hypothetical protein [Rhodopirellula sp. UBA1907]